MGQKAASEQYENKSLIKFKVRKLHPVKKNFITLINLMQKFFFYYKNNSKFIENNKQCFKKQNSIYYD